MGDKPDWEVLWPRTDQDGNGVRGGRLGAEVESTPDPRWLQFDSVARGDVVAVRRQLPKARRRSGWDCYRLHGPRKYPKGG
jgi:hypothetical protein